MAKHPLATALWSQNRDTTAIRKAEDFAKFTITSLMADPLLQTGPNAQVLEYGFQSLGALLVNNLTAKLVMILFPPGRPAFRIEVSEEILQAAKAKGIDEAEITNKAAQLEQQSTKRLFVNAGLSKLHRALKLLIVTGNALIYRDTQTGKFLVWSAIREIADGDAQAAASVSLAAWWNADTAARTCTQSPLRPTTCSG